MPLVILVVFGQAVVAYILVDQVAVRRLMGPQLEALEEVKADIPISDVPERVYQGLGEFLINPADTSDEQGLRFLRAQISLGVSPANLTSELESRQPHLRDIVLQILGGKTVSEMDDPEDREFIKDEIKFSIEALLRNNDIQGEILEVYLTDFIIQ